MNNDWFFREPEAFLWLLAVLAVVGAFGYGMQRRWRTLLAFVDPGMLRRLAPDAGRQRWWRLGLACSTLGCVVLALARPVSNPHPREVARSSRDLIFVLDVSRSMFAEDCVPNRLAAAKLAIADCVAGLPGQRVGLVVFAGTAAIKCPLTSDHLFFNQLLEKVGPSEVSHGGTIIRDALLKSCEKLLTEERAGFQDLVLITDGGRQEDSYETAVNRLNELQARLITIGLGSDRQGVRIPSDDPESSFPYVTYENREVRTKLESAYLQRLTGSVERGVFLPVGTRTVDLAAVYGKIIASDPALKEEEESLLVYDEHFRWFVAMAAVLLAWMLVPAARVDGGRRKVAGAVGVGVLLISCLPLTGRAQDGGVYDEAAGIPEPTDEPAYVGLSDGEIYNVGNDLYRTRDYDGAIAAYRQALSTLAGKHASRCAFNLGNANYQLAAKARMIDAGTALAYVHEAIAAYRRSLAGSADAGRARINLELSVRLRAALEETLRQQQQQQQEQQQQEQEGDPSETGEEGDSDEGEGEESSDGEAEMASMSAGDSDLKVDLQAEGTPPPSLDPQDVLEQERQNNARRAQSNSNRSPGKVEKDW